MPATEESLPVLVARHPHRVRYKKCHLLECSGHYADVP